MSGPVPKRSEQRRRRNQPDGPAPVRVVSHSKPEWPDPDERWHELAIDWYRSLEASGQARFYEPSDIQVARFVAELMSRALKAPGRVSAQLIAAILSAQANLLTTEGDRRRARVELEHEEETEEDPTIAIMDRYRNAAR